MAEGKEHNSVEGLDIGMIKNRKANIKDEDIAKDSKSAVIIDARALYDAINKETSAGYRQNANSRTV